MKKCEKYNMKTEFEKLRDFDFMVFMFVCFFLMVIVLLS